MKKCLVLLLTAVLLFGSFAGTAFAAQALLGDVDGDGKYAATDARLALRAAVKLETLTVEQTARADVDHSGTITAQDARTILRASVKLEELDPVTGLFVPVQVTSPAEKLRTYLKTNATVVEDGVYFYTIEIYDNNRLTGFRFMLDETGCDNHPFYVGIGTVGLTGPEYDVFLWFDEIFSDYLAIFKVFEGNECVLEAEYNIDPAKLSLETAASALTESYYNGDPSVKDAVQELTGQMAVAALMALVDELNEHNVDVDYEDDMHLPLLMEIPTE